jgi:hypothetical protein
VDPDAGIAVGQIGSAHCHVPEHLHFASPYMQSESVPSWPAYAMHALPFAGRAAGQVQRRASLTTPQAQT